MNNKELINNFNTNYYALLGEIPITNIDIFTTSDARRFEAPDGYAIIKRTISNQYSADLNSGNGGKHVFICFTTDIAPTATNNPKCLTGLGTFFILFKLINY